MHPELHSRFASERLKDDHAGLRVEEEGAATLHSMPITIRPLRDGDTAAVERLAELDERPVPSGRLLLAEVGGTIQAVVALDGGETVANPFARTGEAVSLLQVRREQLRAA